MVPFFSGKYFFRVFGTLEPQRWASHKPRFLQYTNNPKSEILRISACGRSILAKQPFLLWHNRFRAGPVMQFRKLWLLSFVFFRLGSPFGTDRITKESAQKEVQANHARLDDARRAELLLTEMLPTAIALVMSRRPSFCLPQRCAFHARGSDLSMQGAWGRG